eukprot:5563498-Amphidinium_carterae.1
MVLLLGNSAGSCNLVAMLSKSSIRVPDLNSEHSEEFEAVVGSWLCVGLLAVVQQVQQYNFLQVVF